MTLNRIKTQLFINNQFVDSKSKQTFDTINPATEQIIASVQRASVHDVDIAVQAARDAFVKWRDVSGKDRRDLLLKFADLMEENKEYLAGVESADNGKPISKAREGDIPTAIHTLRYFAGWADKLSGKTIPVEDTATFSMTVHEPIGVVGGIIPWNYPILLFIWKLAPLIACGCTCVIKSSEKTPLSALLLAQLVQEAGFPPGVINVLSGFGPDCGRALARHAHVDKIVFTGSTATGHKIVQYSAESNLKKATLELGGKSPLIVCDDADLEAAADAARDGLFGNSGQVCCASSRIFVDSKVYDRFVQMCVDRAKKITMGTEEGKFQGPQVDEIQFKKILAYIECGKQQGAKCILGGKRYGTTGYYIEPTIFSDVQDEMKIAKEEIFGPVMQLMKFDSIEGVIARSNDTNFGLAAGVFSKDIAKAMGIASRLQAGTVWINEWGNSDVSVPFGGYKQSGWGRDKGQYALDNYMEVKMISFPINKYK